MSGSLIRYVLTAALRDKLALSLGLLLVVTLSLSIFLGSSAMTEQDQFALVFAAGGLRIGGMMALILFTVSFVRRSFDSRDVEFLLSRPISRPTFLFSLSAAVSILALVTGVAITLTLLLILRNPPDAGYFLWSASLVAELIIMVNVALFFAMVLSSVAAASLIIIAFYVLSRLMGQILGIIDAGTAGAAHDILEKIMEFISVFIPRLDLMGQTSWLLYGPTDNVGFGLILVQGTVFTFMVLMAAMIDLVRRQF